MAPVSLPSVFLVMSSFVGPRPPVITTTLLALRAVSTVFIISSSVSDVDTIEITLTPMELSAVDIFEEFVSTICPMRISSPIVQMVAVTISVIVF